MLSQRFSITRTCLSTRNTKQFEQVCFVFNEIRPCDSNAYNKRRLGVCEFKSAADWLIDTANSIGEINDHYVAKQRLIIIISGELKDIFGRNQIPSILLQSIYLLIT